MSSDSVHGAAAIFELLDRWRHFPAYQLERRADIFFALYLPGIVEHALGVKVDPGVIPEFPIKREDNHQSTKVDYFLLSRDRSRAFLVELKTEMESRNEKQDAYLVAAKERGLNALLRDIPLMAAASNQQAKYVHLLSALEAMGLMTLPGDLGAYAFPKVQRGITARLRGAAVLESDAAIEVVYLQPRDAGVGGIVSFQTVANYLSSLDDPLALVFSDYVRRWIEPAASRPAGEGSPVGPRVEGTESPKAGKRDVR